MKADDVCSNEYRHTLQKRYESAGWGASGYGWAPLALQFMQEIGATSVLDYGCGRGTFKRAPEMQGVDVREYDPGIVEKSALPERADLVVCTDVLEHIERDRLPNVLAHLKLLARKGLLLNIATGPAKEILPDGRNAHLIQEKAPWWVAQLAGAGFSRMKTTFGKGIVVKIVVTQ